jgi:alkylation response protein AidB-like acyl-CoA dehydrogenase
VKRSLFDDEHEQFRQSFRTFLQKEVLPNYPLWEQQHHVDRGLWRKAGEQGYLGLGVPEAFGGVGEADYRFNAVIAEEIGRHTVRGLGFSIQNDVALPYLLHLGTPEQQARWLPAVVSGQCIIAIAMTEPGAGSDLGAIKTTAALQGTGEDQYFVLNGSKTFISNGQQAGLIIVAARTGGPDRPGHKGLSLLVLEGDPEGFTRGRNLDKIGMHAQDTSELFFDNVRVPARNLLGELHRGFYALMKNLAQERLSIAIGAVAGAQGILDITLDYVRSRTAFGTPIGSFQNSRFVLAELSTEISIAQVFVDRCLEEHLRGELSPEDAAKAKWWTTELQNRAVDRCLQLHGGYGYMNEYQVARAWRDTRAQTIGGGSTEIMKEIIGRSLGL